MQEILSESHIAPVFEVKISSYYGKPHVDLHGTFDHQRLQAGFGKNIIFTDQLDWSNEDIILAYRGRHKIETTFRLTKDPFLVHGHLCITGPTARSRFMDFPV